MMLIVQTERLAQPSVHSNRWLICCCLALLLATGCDSQPKEKTARPVNSPLVSVPEPAARPADLLQEATFALEAGDEDLAFDLARQVLRERPEDPQSVFLMARLLGQRHRFPEAIAMLNRLAPTTPDARLPILGQTAEWMVQFGQWSEAEQRYRTILNEIPNAALVHRDLARLYVRQGRRMEACKHLSLLCRLGDIEEIELRHLLMIGRAFSGDADLEELSPIGPRGIALQKIGQGDWASARSSLEELDSFEPNEHSLLGRILVNLDDDDALDRWSKESSGMNSNDADAWFAKGAVAAKQGDHSLAIRMLCEAVLLDATDRHSYVLISQSLAHLNMATECQVVANRAAMIATTQMLGSEMSKSPGRDEEKLGLLIETLDQLHRPQESLRWCCVRLSYGRSNGDLSEDELEALTRSIQQRTEQLQIDSDQPSREFLLCGIDMDSLPVDQAGKSVRKTAQ